MQHRRFTIRHLTISGRTLDGPGGVLVVAKRPNETHLEWELIHRTGAATAVEQAPYRLEMDGPSGPLAGDAILVRSDGRSHVFRGAGDLGGFDGFDAAIDDD